MGVIAGAIAEILFNPSSCDAKEIQGPVRIEIDISDLGLTEEDLQLLIEYIDDPESFVAPSHIDEIARNGLRFDTVAPTAPSGSPRRQSR